jgi:hypothetical protein
LQKFLLNRVQKCFFTYSSSVESAEALEKNWML